MIKHGKEISLCSVFGHNYNSAGICEDCGNYDLLKDMRQKHDLV